MSDFGQNRKTILSRSNETAGFDAKGTDRFSDISYFIRDIHDHMAILERALHDEVDRRIASEDRIREQVDAKVKIAVERLADLTETEMARMYRRIEADVMDRLDSLSREVASLSSNLTKLNRQIEIVTVETRQNGEFISRLDGKRIVSSDSHSGRSEQSCGVVSEMGKNELIKLHNVIENDMATSKKIAELSDQVENKLFMRLETMEDWLKGNLTPEILRLKEAIKSERMLREENDREIMQIVGQYTEVMRRHFSSVAAGVNSQTFPETRPERVSDISESKKEFSNEVKRGSDMNLEANSKQINLDDRMHEKGRMSSSVSKFMSFAFGGSAEGRQKIADESEREDTSKTGGRKNLDKVLNGV